MSAPRSPLSANEVRFFFTRAAVGSGTSYGIGDEIAGAALWLAAAGFDPAGVMAPALDELSEGRSSGKLESIGAGAARAVEVPGGAVASALFAGPALGDMVGVTKGGAVRRVDAPLVVVAALGAMRGSGRWAVGISGPAGRVAVSLTPATLSVSPGFKALHRLDGPVDIDVTELGSHSAEEAPGPGNETRDLAAGRRRVIEEGVAIAGAGWDRVEQCFRNCLVPSSEASRLAGAGAGLTDND